jgi:hypothetical protein
MERQAASAFVSGRLRENDGERGGAASAGSRLKPRRGSLSLKRREFKVPREAQ